MEAPAATKAATKPIKTFSLDGVSASVFANAREAKGTTRTFYGVSVSRTYTKDGEYKRTYSFAPGDLAKLLFVVKQAGDFIDTLPPTQQSSTED